MAHSIVPCFECLRSQFFQPIAAQEYKTMQVHKTLQHGFSILRKVKCPQNEKCSWLQYMCVFFHSCTVHLDAIKVFYLPTDAQ